MVASFLERKSRANCRQAQLPLGAGGLRWPHPAQTEVGCGWGAPDATWHLREIPSVQEPSFSDWCLCALTNKAWALLPLVGCQQWGSSGLDGLAANTWITSLMKMLLEARWLTAKADLRGNYVGHSAKWFIEHSVLLKTHLKEFKRGKEKKKKSNIWGKAAPPRIFASVSENSLLPEQT